MKRFVGVGGIALLFVQVAITNGVAAVLELDWKTPRDGLLTFDAVNKREWLDLSQTLLQQFPGDTIEDRYQSVVGQLAPSGLFEGFTVATREDVNALAQSAGIDTSTSSFPINSAPANLLVDLLSVTRDLGSGSKFSLGLLSETEQSSRWGSLFYVDVVSGPDGLAGLRLTTQYSQLSPPAVMLFREVPEPSAMVLLGLGFVGLQVLGKFRHNSKLSGLILN